MLVVTSVVQFTFAYTMNTTIPDLSESLHLCDDDLIYIVMAAVTVYSLLMMDNVPHLIQASRELLAFAYSLPPSPSLFILGVSADIVYRLLMMDHLFHLIQSLVIALFSVELIFDGHRRQVES